MKSNFARSLKAVLAYEGGYVNHPKDPGGPTNKGITQRVYDAWLAGQGKKAKSVKLIPDDEVAAIYRRQYWDLVRGDSLPAGVDLALFDFAVNSGVSRAVRAAQKVAGEKQDGVLGEVTMAKLKQADAVSFIEAYCAERLRFVQSLRTYSTFGQGWFRRIMGRAEGAQVKDTGIVDLAVALAMGSKPVIEISKETKELEKGKADPADVKIEATPEGAAGGTGAIGGAGVIAAKSGIGAWIGDQIINLGELAGLTKDQVEPLVQYSSYIGWLFVALTFAGAMGIVAVRIKRQKEGRA